MLGVGFQFAVGRLYSFNILSDRCAALGRTPAARSCVCFALKRARADPSASTMTSVLIEESVMTRKYIDCRECPSDIGCSVALSADSESELLEAAVQHAVAAHKHADSPELRAQLRSMFHDGTPPVNAPNASQA
jgi:predicted small metal-binding protein